MWRLEKRRGGQNRRYLADASDMLKAIDRALKANPSDETRSITSVAELTARTYIALDVEPLKVFIRKGMTHEERAERKIEQPRKFASTS